MQKYYIDNNSDSLLLFFAGWGCDEYEFEHLHSNSDVLILYDYLDLKLEFDFSKYKKIDLIAFSAGVFVSSVLNFDFKIDKRIAISGNPLLFDEHFGLSEDMQKVLYNITEENADDFARNYLVKTDAEWRNFHNSKRTSVSCRMELIKLKELYMANKKNIKDNFDNVIFGECDTIFNVSAQKEFYGKRLKVIENARHNIFFRIKEYGEVFNLA